MSGSAPSTSVSVWRTVAEASTIRTRILRAAATGSDPLEDGAGDLLHRQVDADHRIRMGGEQHAARAQMGAEPAQHLRLGWLVEIDQDVAAEDHVHVVVH